MKTLWTSVFDQLSSKSSKYPRIKAMTETYRVQWNTFQMILCLRRQNSWWKCRRPFSRTIQQRTVEQIVDAKVPRAVEELAKVFRVFSEDRIQQRTVEQTFPAIPLAEKIVELPFIQTEEKAQQVANTLVQHDVDTVEVEKPKIIKETKQRMKPIIQEKINQVIKHVEIPELQFTDKVVDNLVVAQRQTSMVQPVQKKIEIPQLQYCDDAIDVPVFWPCKSNVCVS